MLALVRPLVTAAASVLVLASCASGADVPPSPSPTELPGQVTEALDEQLAASLADNDVPGGFVAVCVPGYEDWVDAQGVVDRESGEAMTADLVWPLRSVTKSFAVTLLLQLVDEGKVALDDTIDMWVDDVPNGDRITLDQLARMSSGVPEYTTPAWIDDFTEDPSRAFTPEELIDYALAEPAEFAPGEKNVYTNTNTLLIGQVVAAEYGVPFEQALDERILQPLGLDDTTYPTSVDEWPGDHPTGYQPDDDGRLQAAPNNFTVFGAAGAMTSTAADLCRWGRALGEGELLQPQTQQARVKGEPLDAGPEYDEYAAGVGTLEGWVGHTGEGFGHTVLVMHQPDTRATAVVGMNVSNMTAHLPTRYFREVASVIESVPPAGG